MKKSTLTINLLVFLFLSTSFIAYADVYYPHIACTSKWDSEISVINTSTETVKGIFEAYDDAGNDVLDNIEVMTLPPHARKQITVGSQFSSPSNIGYIIFKTNSKNVVGYTKFYINGKYRVAVPAILKINTGDLYISHIASNDDWWTGVSIVNTTSAPKTLAITFDDDTTKSIALAGKQHYVFNIKSLFGNVSQPALHSAVIKNADGVIGLELFCKGNQLSGILLKNDTTKNMYYPHIAAGKWWTGIVAYNPSASRCKLTINPYKTDGTALVSQEVELNAYEKYIGTITTLGLPTDAAWFAIEAEKPITGFELFGTSDGNLLAGYTGVNISSKEGVFAKIEKNGWTGIAFVNITNNTANVQLTAYNDSGSVIDSKSIRLNPYQKLVNNPENIFLKDISNATYISYSSDHELVGFQLNGSSDDMMLDGLPGLFAGNGSGNTSKHSVNITTGTKVNVETVTVTESGDYIYIDDKSSVLNKFDIYIPANAFDSDVDFKISYHPITGHDGGPNFNPLTPLIEIDNGGQYSDEIMDLLIPADIPEGHFAMAFFYYEQTGELQAMPFIRQGASYVLVATRHFSKFVVSSIPKEDLFSALPIKSGFDPGEDDWQFANRGSQIAPGGHCAGQSLAAAWYYKEKYCDGEPSLYGAWDNNGNQKTSQIWYDDAYAYRFCSVIQRDINWSVLSENIDMEFQTNNQNQVWMAFAYSILISDMPQLIGIYTDADKDGKRGGHAMVIHGVDETDTNGEYQLLVADPNYPGQTRSIKFDTTGTFSPYSSAANAEDAAKGYGSWFTSFYFCGLGGLMPWNKIQPRWEEVIDGSIGNDMFWDCNIYASVLEDEGWKELEIKDKFLAVSDPAPEISVRIPDGEGGYIYPDKYFFTDMNKPDATFVAYDKMHTVSLEEGDNFLGVYSVQKYPVGGYDYYKYINFEWINLYYTPMPGYELLGFQKQDQLLFEAQSFSPPPYNVSGRITAPNMEDIQDEIITIGKEFEQLSFWVTVSKLPFNMSVTINVSDLWTIHYYENSNGMQNTITYLYSDFILSQTMKDGSIYKRDGWRDYGSSASATLDISVNDNVLQPITDGTYISEAVINMTYTYRLVSIYGDDEYITLKPHDLALLQLFVFVKVVP